MFRWIALAVALTSCSSPSRPPTVKPAADDVDPDGPHRAAVAAQLAPYLEGEILGSVVVGLYDAGRKEIYGFGKGPGGRVPDGGTLYELGSVTKVYTGLLLADAVQRREVALETPVSELLPPGVTVPTFQKQPITLQHLAVHTSGLPRLPPGVDPASPDPYAKYDEDALYRDLIRIELEVPPGARILYSNYGAGLLGFALGRKLGSYPQALQTRVLAPLELRDTMFTVPPAAAARRAPGVDVDLKPVPLWTWSALAGAGALVTSVRDQLRFLDAQLDALAGGRGTLRNPMRLTQENQLEGTGAAQGLGWLVDSAGRFWHNGGTGGFRAFVSFDPKTRRGVVVLAAGATSLVDRLGRALQDVLDKTAKDPAKLPSAEQRAAYVGAYDLAGTRIAIVADGSRLYIEGPGEPRHRLAPVSPTEFWVEALQSVATFQSDEAKQVTQLNFDIGGRQLVAPRAK